MPVNRLFFQLLRVLIPFLLCNAGNAQTHWDHVTAFGTRDHLAHEVVLSINQDALGYLWVGTQNGLSRYNGSDFESVAFPASASTPSEPPMIESIYRDQQDLLWIGSRSGQIACYQPSEQRWTGPFLWTNGQRTEAIFTFKQAPDGAIWFGGAMGSFGRLDASDVSIQVKGQLSNQIRSLSVFKDQLVINNLQLYDSTGRPQSLLNHTAEVIFTGNHEQSTHYSLSGNELHINSGTSKFKVPLPIELIGENNLVFSINSRGALLIASPQVICTIDADGMLLDQLPISDGQAPENLYLNAIFEDRTGVIWLGTNSGLLKVDRSHFRFKKWSSQHDSRNLSQNYVRTIYRDRNDALWVGFKNGSINRLRENHIEVYRFPGHTLTTNCALHHSSGQILFGCTEGLFAKSTSESSVRPISLPGDSLYSVWSLYEDDAGLLWVGTLKRGILLLDANLHPLAHFDQLPAKASAINQAVWTFYKDQRGQIWLGTDNGLKQLFIDSAAFSNGRYNQAVSFKSVSEKEPFNRIGKHVWHLQEDPSGRLWIGTTDKGISIFNPVDSSFKQLDLESGFPFSCISGLCFDQHGFTWVSTINGLFRLDSTLRIVHHYTQGDGLISNDFNFKACVTDPAGNLYFGSKTGMIQLNPTDFLETDSAWIQPLIPSLDVLGESFAHDLQDGDTIELRHNQNFLRMQLALLDFRSSENQVLHYKLHGFDQQVQIRTMAQPYADYTNIPPGTYRFEFSVLDNPKAPTKPSTQIIFVVKPALWQRLPLQLLAGFILLGLFSLFFIAEARAYAARKSEEERIKRELAEMELKALQTQMNPHFIFNALNAIQHYVVKHDVEKVNAYLGKFSQLMRQILESSKQRFIPLEEEIQLLRNYVDLEQLRFGHRFDYRFEVEMATATSQAEIPSMFIQPFVENAINHGLVHLKQKGVLLIQFSETEDAICCTIDDNGIGRIKSQKIKEEQAAYRSRSMEIIAEQTERFQKDGLLIEVNTTDKTAPKSGTTVTLKIAKEHVERTDH